MVLFSQFILDQDRFVISAENIVEIIPMIALKSEPKLPDYVAGLLNYHGDIVPVVDLCALLIGRPSARKLSTRIIIVDNGEQDGIPRLLGMLTEKATEMVRIDDGGFRASPLVNESAIVDGPVAEVDGMLVTRVDVHELYSRVDQKIFSTDTGMK